MNRAISAIYEPGSTFKLITLAAAFDQNLIRADEVFNCENGAVTVAGHLIHDHKKYGMLTVADILANSSDVGAIKIALATGLAEILRLHPRLRIWLAHRRGPARRKPRTARASATLGLLFDCLCFHGAGSGRDAAADDYGGFRDRQWRLALQAARGRGNAARRCSVAAGWSFGDRPIPSASFVRKRRRPCAG